MCALEAEWVLTAENPQCGLHAGQEVMRVPVGEVRGRKPRKNADLTVIFALGGERKSVFPRPAMPLRYIICTLIMKIISELFIILNGRI